MRRILVINVAAEYGGAITVLNSFIKEAELTMDAEFTFLVSNKSISSHSGNINIQYKQWVKKSWFHRLFFELMYLNYIFPMKSFDSVVSLQNTLLTRKFKNQSKYILVHQSIQFFKGYFNIFRLEGLKIFLRKHLIGFIIKSSVKFADVVFTQTQWMRNRLSDWISMDKIIMISMTSQMPPISIKGFNHLDWKNSFIYPAHAGFLKNHISIVNTLVWMKEKSIPLPEVFFSIDIGENATAKDLNKKVRKNNLPIHFVGPLSQNELFEYFKKCVVLFPSKIETFGLPLLESRSLGTPIIAIDLPYAREVLDGYKQAYFFKTNADLAFIIQQMMNGSISLEFVEDKVSNQTFPTMIEIITRGLKSNGE